MNNRRPLLLVVLAALVLSAATGGFAFLKRSRETDSLRQLVILYTNDEHGILEASPGNGGSAGMLALWRKREGYDPAAGGKFLVLSGGDRFTGPALSSYLKGESMADVMNAMGYQAAALGNHDFDFGLEALRERARQSSFPILSANLVEHDSGKAPDFVQPYTVITVNHIPIGLVGLTTLETPVDTQPTTVADFDFLSYQQALRETAPLARRDGAKLIIVIGHICQRDLEVLAPAASELGIPILAGGHCHERVNESLNGVTLIESGAYLETYTKVDLYFDLNRGKIATQIINQVDNLPGKQDAQLKDRIAAWHDRIDPSLWKPLGYCQKGFSRSSPEIARLLTSAWLAADPGADAAIASHRHLQAPLPAGSITPATLWDMLPTQNTLIEMHITGQQLIDVLTSRQPIWNGVRTEAGFRFLNGQALDPAAVYKVLIPKALYDGGNYYEVKQLDQNAIDTGIDWRQAVIDWISQQGSSQSNPLFK